MHEVVIIGGGPAGMTAAVYAARKRMDVVMISPEIGGQASWAVEVENYLGFEMISGVDLAEKFEAHVHKFGVPIEYDKVTSLEIHGPTFVVKSESGKEYETKTAIIATGRSGRNLGVPGEEEFKRRGVAYCATCDAPLFFDLVVAVVGGGNAGLSAAVQLSKIAKQVYIIERFPELTGDSQFLNAISTAANVQILASTQVLSILGEKMVTGIRLMDLKTKEERTLPVEGVFIEVGSMPNTEFVPSDVRKNKHGEIEVDCSNRTSVPGLFAAGDSTSVPHKQIIIAAGEGAKALLSAYDYLVRSA
jgi:alkyl hydroperoxide reductase subunit F